MTDIPAPRTILSFWRDIEFFIPFDLNDVIQREDRAKLLTLEEGGALPWHDPEAWDLDLEWEYGYDLFLGLLEKREVERVLSVLPERFPGGSNFDDARDLEGLTCVARVNISPQGQLSTADLRISTLPWALNALLSSTPLRLHLFEQYGELLALRLSEVAAQGEAVDEEDDEVPVMLSLDDLLTLCSAATQGLALEWLPGHPVVIVAYPLRKRKPEPETKDGAEDDQTGTRSERAADLAEAMDATAKLQAKKRRFDILNSFYLTDLQRVAEGGDPLLSSRSTPLGAYFSSGSGTQRRVNLLEPSPAFEATLSPERTPRGHWFFPPDHRLTLMQQFAVNHYFNGEEPLVAVNGPPGTGKTTLLKEIVAELIVQRARVLSRCKSPDEAFENTALEVQHGRKALRFFPLKETLTGFEIVVASSNNTAVENISLELPRHGELAEEYKDLTFVQPVMALLTELRGLELGRTPPWGLVSAPLGNRRNRTRFATACFFGPAESQKERARRREQRERLTLFEWRKQVPEGMVSFARARALFEDAFRRCDDAAGALTRGASQLDSTSASARTPDADFHSLEMQNKVAWITDDYNRSRSQLLAAALQLQEAWIRESRKLDGALVAISRLLQWPGNFSRTESRALWHCLFMVVPVVSTTLASVERMLGALGPGALGHVLIDEGGQATPQSVVGVLWRAKRALIVGDPQQIQPVVTIPERLERHLAAEHATASRELSPRTSSAQQLADRAVSFGGLLPLGDSPLWVGCPLRVHRRCQEPMFSLSNLVAYGNTMIFATPPHRARSPLGESGWFDVRGRATARQWVPEQGSFAARLLELLIDDSRRRELDGAAIPDVFFITPFREVRGRLLGALARRARDLGVPQKERSALRQRVGTIHTFQGKEASIVVLVLGCDSYSHGAAWWAGDPPNLVNVAVSRARDFFYVVGDLSVWHDKGYFNVLATELRRRNTRELE